MKDDPSEFSSVMNLILPLNSQFINEKLFINNYFDKDGIFKKSMIEDFQTHIKGRVSYLKSMPSEVQKIFIGEKLRNLKHFIVYPDRMSDFQSTHYLKAFEKDRTERSIFINSRQSSLFVFPDGTSGNLGFNQTRYVQKRKIVDGGINLIGDDNKKIVKISYTLGRELINELTENSRQNGLIGSLSKLQKFSSKYAKTIKIINETYPSKNLVYCEYVNGSGAIMFAKLLELFGFSEATGKEITKKKRYILLTDQTANPKNLGKLIEKFNEVENIDGEYISVIIGSRIISEGFTFKNIRREFILTAHWVTYITLLVSYFVLLFVI